LTELEAKYQQSIVNTLKKVTPLGRVDLVIGIPFTSTSKDLYALISILESGLDTYYPEIKSIIFCIISPSRSLSRTIKAFKSQKKERVIFTQLDQSLSRRSWSYRGLLEVARKLSADLFIVEASLLPNPAAIAKERLSPDWIKVMYQPVKDRSAYFVLPRFKLSHLSNWVDFHFVFPLWASLYNVELQSCLNAGMVISHEILPKLVYELSHSDDRIFEFGFTYWLVSWILASNTPIAEVSLGIQPQEYMPGEAERVFSQAARVLFDYLGKHQNVWMNTPQAIRSALQIGRQEHLFVKDLPIDVLPHLLQFQRGYDRYFEALWSRIFSEGIRTQLIQMVKEASSDAKAFCFPASLWAKVVYEAIVAYHFIPGLEKEDVIDSLESLFEGRLAAYFQEVSIPVCVVQTQEGLSADVCPFSAQVHLAAQIDAFVNRKSSFLEQWLHHKEHLEPFLPEVTYWEYIPEIPIMLPHVVRSPSGNRAHVYSFYEKLLKEYTDDFKEFIKENLQLTPADGSEKVGQGIRSLMTRLEKDLDQYLIPGNIHSKKGIRQIAEKIFRLFPFPQSMSLKEEVAARLIRETPPRNLIIIWGYRDEEELLEHHNPLDVMAIASWSETSRFSIGNTQWLRENLTPDDFEMSPVVPVIVGHADFPALSGMHDAASLDYITSRVVISNLKEGAGGEFPKTLFLTTILRHIIRSIEYGRIWEYYIQVSGTEDFANKVVNSVQNIWSVGVFSAHSIFEHLLQTMLRDKLLEIAQQDWGSSGPAAERAKEHLARMAKAYYLGLTLPDGVFATCCMWSWASYSFRGGENMPTPLSLIVERRWFSGELFARLYEQVVGSRKDIPHIIYDLMGENKENEDLSVMYLGSTSVRATVVVDQKTDKIFSSAGQLIRSPHNPILAPMADHPWENKYVLNCGVIRVRGNVYIFYRAVGEDGISRIGLAMSQNGLQISERFNDPVFSPANESEKRGCEDPRLISMDGRIYMLYTAYDGITPQIALASISEEELIAHDWAKWHRHGLLFPGLSNKDAILYPERFNGKIALYHRIAPSIWITYSNSLETPWPKEGHKIIMGTRSGMFWDAVKIGAGAPPLKTKFGWLHIYHGVDYAFTYRLGIFLTDLHDPEKITYRSPNAILEPETSYEMGLSGKSWVPNVVFTCGAVPTVDKKVLDENDEILVYYGGADTVIGVASAKLKDIIPEQYRQHM